MNFIYINQNVLNNLLYILSSVFVFYFIYDNGMFFKKHKKSLIVICTSVPLILCMKYPIYIDGNCVHDLRQIPFFIGTLYGGLPVGIALLTIMLLIRFVFYGVNFLTVIVYITMLVFTAFSSSKFKQLNRRKNLLCQWFYLFPCYTNNFYRCDFIGFSNYKIIYYLFYSTPSCYHAICCIYE